MTEREKLADRIDPRKRPDAFIVLDGKRYANWASADADLIAAADILRASPTDAHRAAAEEIEKFVPRYFSDGTLCPACGVDAGVCSHSFADMLTAIIDCALGATHG